MNKSVTRVIALEEAFLHPRLRELYPPRYVAELDLLKGRLADVGPERIQRMDAAGIDLQVLSHVSPGVQTLDGEVAIRLSKEVNDWLGAIVRTHPTRFAGFATLPTQSPGDAADELERTVRQLGFKGALINGHTQGKYLDDDFFSVILERAEALDVLANCCPVEENRIRAAAPDAEERSLLPAGERVHHNQRRLRSRGPGLCACGAGHRQHPVLGRRSIQRQFRGRRLSEFRKTLTGG
jgi:hypothetical protein